jgi:serine/threonine protein kinase
MDLYTDTNRTLSVGGFGIIYKCTDKAVKVVYNRHGSIQNLLEIILYFSLSMYLVQAYSYEITKMCYKIHMPLGIYDLSRALKCKVAKTFDIISILYNVSLGVEYLHSRNIVHGDIKPSNILIFKNDKKYTGRITDFSLSALCFDRIYNKYAYTNGYRPPEVELKGSYDFKADIWALGQTFKKAQERFPSLQTKEFDNLICNMTLNKEDNRYSIYDVLANNIFNADVAILKGIKSYNIAKLLEISEEKVFISNLINKMMRKVISEDENFINREISHLKTIIHFFQTNVF